MMAVMSDEAPADFDLIGYLQKKFGDHEPGEAERYALTGGVEVDNADVHYAAALLCARCLIGPDLRLFRVQKIRDCRAITVTKGEALCMHHLMWGDRDAGDAQAT